MCFRHKASKLHEVLEIFWEELLNDSQLTGVLDADKTARKEDYKWIPVTPRRDSSDVFCAQRRFQFESVFPLEIGVSATESSPLFRVWLL